MKERKIIPEKELKDVEADFDEIGKKEIEEMEQEERLREAEQEERIREVEEDAEKRIKEDEKFWKEKKQEELDERIREAEERIKERPLTWRPQPGERKAVEVLEKVKKDTEFGSTPFFVLKDLRTSQLYSLLAAAVLEKHLEIGKEYLLVYEGKVENADKSYHRWIWEELE